jgi:hypothetical protein
MNMDTSSSSNENLDPALPAGVANLLFNSHPIASASTSRHAVVSPLVSGAPQVQVASQASGHRLSQVQPLSSNSINVAANVSNPVNVRVPMTPTRFFHDCIIVANCYSEDPVRAMAAAVALDSSSTLAPHRIRDNMLKSDLVLIYSVAYFIGLFDQWVNSGTTQPFVTTVFHKIRNDRNFWHFLANPIQRNENHVITRVINMGIDCNTIPYFLPDPQVFTRLPIFRSFPIDAQREMSMIIVEYSCHGRYHSPLNTGSQNSSTDPPNQSQPTPSTSTI